MTKAEHKGRDTSDFLIPTKHLDFENQLEFVDENENPIERCFKQDRLLEEQDRLIDQVDETRTNEKS